MSRREEMAVAAQGAGPLTQHQTRALVLLARRAYALQRKCGLVEEGVSFDEWRRAAVADAAPGRAGLTKLTQADFRPVRDWLRRLAGEEPQTAGGRPRTPAELRAADELARAEWALARAAERAAPFFDGGAEGAARYADAILRDQCGGEAPDARAVWRAVYTLRSRAKARKRARSAPGAPNGPECPAAAPRVFPRVSRAVSGLCGR